jgi:hypothetical protein
MSTPNADEGKTPQQIWDEMAAETGNLETPAPAPVEDPTKAEPVKPAPVAPAATAPVVVPPVVQDPYEGLSPGLKQKMIDLESLAGRTRKVEGHVGNLTAENKRLVDELATLKALPARQKPSEQQVQKAAKSTDKWDALTKEFPEWAEAVNERLGNNAEPDIDALRSQIREELTADLTTNITATVRASIAAETEVRLLNVAHRGWRDTINSPAFKAWQGSQPEDVRNLAFSDKAEDAMEMLDLYKAQQPDAQRQIDPNAILEARRKQLADAASVARGNGAGLVPIRSTDDMTDKEYWDFLAAERAKKK